MFEEALEWLVKRARKKIYPSLFTKEMLLDPYPTYARLRSEEPVYWDRADSRWVITRYADIVAVLKNPAASSDRTAATMSMVPPQVRPLMAFRANSMIHSDGIKHNRLRLLVSKAFTARAVETM